MKKKFNKKGFTLVEMIVVIAIIGVLAAILTPMLIGYVLQSRIAAANQAAARIRDSVTYFLTQADCNDYGMLLSGNSECEADVVIDGGEWTVTVSDTTVFMDKTDVKWEEDGTSNASADVSKSLNATEKLAHHLALAFSNEKYGFAKMKLIGGMCTAIYYTKDQNTAVTNFPGFGEYNGWSVPDYAWFDDEQGLYNSGIVVGTAPVLPISDLDL